MSTRFKMSYDRCERCKRVATNVQAIREGWFAQTTDGINFTYVCPGCVTLDEERKGEATKDVFEAAYEVITKAGQLLKTDRDKERGR